MKDKGESASRAQEYGNDHSMSCLGLNLSASSKEGVTRCFHCRKLLHLFNTLNPIGDVYMAYHHFISSVVAADADIYIRDTLGRPVMLLTRPAMSLVEQINKILQKNLSGTPLGKRYICLVEDPSGGVIVKVDRESFMGVDAVIDPEIKAAIKAAVAQWEKEQ